MNYFIKRDLSEFGPYTLAELQRYVASGNVLLTDVCRSDGMTEWMPVSQIIGTIPVPAPAPPQAAAVPASPYPPPPSLHWGLVVLFTVLTCGIFHGVWGIVQASWVKKVQPTSKAMIYYIIAIGVYAFAIVGSLAGPGPRAFAPLVNLIGWVIWLVGAFNMRSSIEEHYNSAEPIGLQLSGVMTFFFNVYYFQYHFTQIAKMKEMQATGQRV